MPEIQTSLNREIYHVRETSQSGDPLTEHLKRVSQLHKKELQEGFGRVNIPYALDRKYPNAGKKWSWQYVFYSMSHFVSAIDIRPHDHPLPLRCDNHKTVVMVQSGVNPNPTIKTLTKIAKELEVGVDDLIK